MHSPGRLAQLVDRGSSKVIDKVDKGQAKLRAMSSGSGLLARIASRAPARWLLRLVRTDTEAVKGEVLVEATLKNGTALRLPLQVEDVSASRLLQRSSLVTELVALVPVVPLIGTVVPAVAAAVAVLGAAVARLDHRPDLARALIKTSAKYLVEAAMVIPVAGSIIVAAAAAADAADVRRLSASPAPTVADLDALGAVAVRPAKP